MTATSLVQFIFLPLGRHLQQQPKMGLSSPVVLYPMLYLRPKKPESLVVICRVKSTPSKMIINRISSQNLSNNSFSNVALLGTMGMSLCLCQDREGTFYGDNMGNFNGIGHDVAPSSWSPLCKTSKLSKMKDRTYMRFSVEDTLKLIEGVKKFGRSWKSIKSVYFMDSNRTKDQLKEKWKHMMKSAHKQSDPFLKKLYIQSVDIGNNVPKPSEIKPVYYNRKICYKRKRSQRDYPSGKRKIYDICGSVSKFGGNSSNGITGSPGKGFNCDASGSASGISACVAGQQTHFQSRDSNVKIRIKSFKVPEFLIEIPEFATVGSLKRIVMEAVAVKLRGELRVGVLIHGKKIRDDNKTLLQTGISHDNKLDALGFSLEPNPSQALPPMS